MANIIAIRYTSSQSQSASGSTENAGQKMQDQNRMENAGPKMWDRKMEDKPPEGGYFI